MTHTLDKTPALKLFLQYLSNKLGKHQHFDHKNNAAVEFYYCDLWALPPLPSSSLFRETVGTWVHFIPFQTHEAFAYGRNCSFLFYIYIFNIGYQICARQQPTVAFVAKAFGFFPMVIDD